MPDPTDTAKIYHIRFARPYEARSSGSFRADTDNVATTAAEYCAKQVAMFGIDKLRIALSGEIGFSSIAERSGAEGSIS
jgi:hypothetical protein